MSGLSRWQLEQKYQQWRVSIQNNVGGGGRYSVETSEHSPLGCGVLGICNTIREAEEIIEDAIEMKREEQNGGSS